MWVVYPGLPTWEMVATSETYNSLRSSVLATLIVRVPVVVAENLRKHGGESIIPGLGLPHAGRTPWLRRSARRACHTHACGPRLAIG